MNLALQVDILREFGHLINVPADFNYLQHPEKHRWAEEAFTKWFQTVAHSPPPGVRRLLLTKVTRFGAPTAYRRLQQIARDLIESREASVEPDAARTSADWHTETRNLLQSMEALAQIGARLKNDTDDFLAVNLRDIATSYQRLMRRQALGTCDDDVIAKEIEMLATKPSWRWRGGASTLGGVNRRELLEQRDRLKACIDEYVLRSQSDTAALLRQELTAVRRLYEDTKTRRRALDDHDVVRKTDALLRDHPEVIQTLQTRHDHVFVGDSRLVEPSREKVEPALVILRMPAPRSRYARVMPFQIEQALPETISAFVAALVGTADTSHVRSAGSLPSIDPTQVCLVFPRFYSANGEDVRAPYMRALEARGIGYTATETRQSFIGREEVRALCTALAAIEWPNDELQVYATLRGPLFGFNDESLFLFRQRFGLLQAQAIQLPLDLNQNDADSAQLVAIADVLRVLETLHTQRNYRRIIDTYDDLLEYAQVRANLAFWCAGSQALQSVEMLSELASNFATQDVPSFRSFVRYLQQADGAFPILPSGSTKGANRVRLLTLEEMHGHVFSAAILCDPTAQLDDSKAFETVVSHTRDIVAVPTLDGAPIDGWLTHFSTSTSQPVRKIAWEPNAQASDTTPTKGLRHQHTLEQGNDDTGRARFEAWLAEHQAVREAAARPSLAIAHTKATAPSLPAEVQLRTERYAGDAHPAAKLAWIISQPLFLQAVEARMQKQGLLQVPVIYNDAQGNLVECRCDYVFGPIQDNGWTVINVRSAPDASTQSQYEVELTHCAFGVYKATSRPVQAILLLV